MLAHEPMLYVPGGDPAKLAKIAKIDARVIILDLEDAVAVSEKSNARAAVRAALMSRGDAELWVRVNPDPPELLYADLQSIVVPGLHGIVIPKVEQAEQVRRIAWLLDAIEADSEQSQPVRLIATIETPTGVRNLDAIASASPRLECLGFGAGDFSLELGLAWPPPSGTLSPTVITAKSLVVLASQRAGLTAPHDGSFPRHNDLDGLRREAQEAKALGFGSKHAIHPAQIAVLRQVFASTDQELARARLIVETFERHEAAGKANVSVDGELVDYPVAEQARRLLAAAGELSTKSTVGD